MPWAAAQPFSGVRPPALAQCAWDMAWAAAQPFTGISRTVAIHSTNRVRAQSAADLQAEAFKGVHPGAERARGCTRGMARGRPGLIATRRRRTMAPNRVWRLGLAAALLGLVLMPALPASAQNTGTVTGRVVDAATQQPLVGAQVVITGTTLGGLAGDDGMYLILNVPAGERVVQAQMIGYANQSARVTVEAGASVTVNLSLSQSAIGLDQIVVTGTAGTGQAKRTLGNSIATVDAGAIAEAMPMTDARQLRQGRAPGVTLVQSTGVVGGGARMRIRGSGSLNAGNEPVVFVDGVRVQSGQSR